MRLLPCYLLLLLALPSAGAAPATTDCSTFQQEVTQLRERVRMLEAALRPVATAPAQTAASTLPGTAAKPAATQTLVIEEPYSRTGCSKGLFAGIAPAKWQNADLWLDLEKGQSPAAVEALLGVEHYDERGGGNVIWHYGKCGAASRAQVLFSNGQLADWRVPAR